jgi:hypothetical protein
MGTLAIAYVTLFAVVEIWKMLVRLFGSREYGSE